MDEYYIQVENGLQQVKFFFEGYRMDKDVFLIYKDMMYIPNSRELIRTIMDEMHTMPYSLPRIKKYVAKHIVR